MRNSTAMSLPHSSHFNVAMVTNATVLKRFREWPLCAHLRAKNGLAETRNSMTYKMTFKRGKR